MLMHISLDFSSTPSSSSQNSKQPASLKLLGLLGHLTLAGLPEDHRRRGALDEVNFIKGVPA
jgi:hypothetical protein